MDPESVLRREMSGGSSPDDFTRMWGVELKATHRQRRRTDKNARTPQGGADRGAGGAGGRKGATHAFAGDLTLGGEHTTPYTGDGS